MVKEYELIHIEISKLKFDASNPNQLTDAELKAMRHSMEKFGYLTPIIVDQNYNIADGEHRVYTYKEAGKTTIPAYVVPCKTDAERRLIRQTLNKLRGHHKRDLDIEEFKILLEAGLKEDLLALLPDNKELEQFLAEDIKEDEFDVDKSLKEPKYKINHGEVWQLDSHRLMCGDATKKEDVDKLMNGEKADMVFTDPPYGVGYELKSDRLGNKEHNKILGDENLNSAKEIWRKAFQNIYDSLNNGGSYYLTAPQGGDQMMMMMMMMMEGNIKCKHELIWVKPSPVFSMGRLDYDYQHEPILYGWKGSHKFYGLGEHKKSVWNIGRDSNKMHPTMKPVELVSNAIKNSSGQGNLIIDLFGGSGSTLIACEQTNRKCFMMEIDEIYCSVIIERFENLTNKKAEKVA